MKLVDHVSRGHANRAYEERSLVADNHVCELWQLAFRVIILQALSNTSQVMQCMETHVGLPSVSSDLRDEQIDTERCIWILKLTF